MRQLCFALVLHLVLLSGAPLGAQAAASAEAIVEGARHARIVLLGEVHDNREQHVVRLAALQGLIAAGGRPAIAFEQFDQDRQTDIDRARRERPDDADHLIASAGGRANWPWEFYRPYVELALTHDLPIVAANLSRAAAIQVARQGWGAKFDAAERDALGLDRLPAEFLAAHVREIDGGHCGLLTQGELEALARAQIARDIVMARSLRPYLSRGVVLLAGNGHVRKDLGVPSWLTPAEREQSVSLGLIEDEARLAPEEMGKRFDRAWTTPTAARADPCVALRQARSKAKASGS